MAKSTQQAENGHRTLVLIADRLGWRTFHKQVMDEFSTDQRQHVDVELLSDSRWTRWLTGSLPGRLRRFDQQALRVYLVWAVVLRLRLRGRLNLYSHIVVATQRRALGLCVGRRRRLTVVIDGTLRQAGAMGARSKWRNACAEPLERWVLRRADRLVGMSMWSITSSIDHYGCDPARGRVMPPRIRLSSPIAEYERSGAVMIANDFVRKGGSDLLDLFSTPPLDKSRLDIVGAGQPQPSGSNVKFCGVVRHDALVQHLLPQYNVLAHPTHQDFSPWVVAEALTVGTPVVSVRLGAIDELVTHGVDGYLVAPGDLAEMRSYLVRALSGDLGSFPRRSPAGSGYYYGHLISDHGPMVSGAEVVRDG